MRVVALIFMTLLGSVAIASDIKIIASETDQMEPDVELNLDTPVERPPLIENYVTDMGQQAAVITPRGGEPYYIVPSEKGSYNERTNSEPINDRQWELMSW